MGKFNLLSTVFKSVLKIRKKIKKEARNGPLKNFYSSQLCFKQWLGCLGIKHTYVKHPDTLIFRNASQKGMSVTQAQLT